MTNITETERWEDGVYMVKRGDVVSGGADGIANIQARQLANRTVFLKSNVDVLKSLALSKNGGDYATPEEAQQAIDAGTETRQYFLVVGSGQYWVRRYENINGIATDTGESYPSAEQLNAVNANVNALSEDLKVVNDVLYSKLLAELSGSGTVELSGRTLVKLKNYKNINSNAVPDISELSMETAGGEKEFLLLPGESISDGVKSSAYTSVRVSDMASYSVGIRSDHALAVLKFSNVEFIYNKINECNAFDKNGSFAPTTQTLAETTATRCVSTHTTGGVQFGIPNDEITAAGYELTASGVIGYLTKKYADTVIHLLTSVTEQSAIASAWFFDAGNITVNVNGSYLLSLMFYEGNTAETEEDITDSAAVKYSADVRNDLVESHTLAPTELRVQFSPGECPSEQCISVSNEEGNNIDAQFLPEPGVNYSTGELYGYYADGSLRSGSVVIEQSYLAGEKKNFIVNVSQNRTRAEAAPKLIAVAEGYQLAFGGRVFTFGSDNGYQLSSVTEGEETLIAKYSAYYHLGATYEIPMAQHGGAIAITHHGRVFVELTTTIVNQYVRAVVRTRITASGKIFVDTVFRAVVDIPENTIYGLSGRLEFYPSVDDKTIDTDRMTLFWRNSGVTRSAHLMYCHGDIHRDGVQYAPTLPAWSTIVDEPNGAINHTRLYGGWRYGTANYPVVAIAEKTAFAHGFYIDLNQQRQSLPAANNVAHNLPIGFLGTGIIARMARRDLLRNLLDYVDAQSNFWDENGTNGKTVAYCAHLAIKKYLGEGEGFDAIYNRFKAYCVTYHGGITNLGQSYLDNILVLQFASRTILPNIQWFYHEAVLLGDEEKQAELIAAITSLADALVKAYNEKGFIPLQYSFVDAPPSNANTTGIRALAIAIKLTGDPDGKYLAALNGVEVYLNKYLKTENIFTENIASILGRAHYLHYADYAYHDYLRACDLLGRQPIMNMSNYVMNAVAGYGALREQIYCISNSRKGSSLTYAYQIYILNKQGGLSGQNACRKLMAHLQEQINPDGTMPRPMDNWPENKNTNAASPVPFEIQAMAEMLLENYYQ